MKPLFLIFFILILNAFNAQNINVQSNKQTTFKSNKQVKVIISFYNLENLYDTINQEFVSDEEYLPQSSKNYNTEKYLDKLTKLNEVLIDLGTNYNPDGFAILGVAEIENRNVLNDLINFSSLKSRDIKIIHFDSKDHRGVDVGMLYNPKYYQPLKSQKIEVSMAELGDSFPTRDILWSSGYLLNEKIHVFVNHWPSRRGGEEATRMKRCKGGTIIRKIIDSIQSISPDDKFVVMGDLNDDPDSYSLTDCLLASSLEKIKGKELFNPFYNLYKKGFGTLAYRDAWSLFDQIIISKEFTTASSNQLKFQYERIYRKDFMINSEGQFQGYPKRTFVGDTYQGGYSDHFPTFIVLSKTLNN
ncbi:MAG: endonuclease/exonuclease/phosphatase family protein [Chitinophagales bacterium]|nr:endonuclease/exonuclease/phosphatase family protein [Chitinophagales bacterium]